MLIYCIYLRTSGLIDSLYCKYTLTLHYSSWAGLFSLLTWKFCYMTSICAEENMNGPTMELMHVVPGMLFAFNQVQEPDSLIIKDDLYYS